METILNYIAPYVQSIIMALTAKYGIAVLILTWLGLFRLCFKPLLSFVHTLADQTKTTKDDALVAKIETSKILKCIFYVLDWLASIKVIR